MRNLLIALLGIILAVNLANISHAIKNVRDKQAFAQCVAPQPFDDSRIARCKLILNRYMKELQ
jgi:hypothetical protein